MIKLEITVKPKAEKYIEFLQTLESIKSDLDQICNSVLISEEDRTFSIIINLNTADQLTTVLCSNELSILSGTIKILAETTEFIVHGIGYKRRSSDLREIRLNYAKTKKEKLINYNHE